MTALPPTAFLIVAALMFATGVYTVIAQRGAVMILMGVELMLNAVGLNVITFWRFTHPQDYGGQVFAILVITVGAVEMALGLGLMMLLYRNRATQNVDDFQELKG